MSILRRGSVNITVRRTALVFDPRHVSIVNSELPQIVGHLYGDGKHEATALPPIAPSSFKLAIAFKFERRVERRHLRQILEKEQFKITIMMLQLYMSALTKVYFACW